MIEMIEIMIKILDQTSFNFFQVYFLIYVAWKAVERLSYIIECLGATLL